MSNYRAIYFTQPGWEAKLNQNNIQLVLIEPNAMLADALRQSSTWKILFEDKLSVVFEKY
jgi:hypothetical protein